MVRSLASAWQNQKQDLVKHLEPTGLRIHQTHQGWMHKPEVMFCHALRKRDWAIE